MNIYWRILFAEGLEIRARELFAPVFHCSRYNISCNYTGAVCELIKPSKKLETKPAIFPLSRDVTWFEMDTFLVLINLHFVRGIKFQIRQNMPCHCSAPETYLHDKRVSAGQIRTVVTNNGYMLDVQNRCLRISTISLISLCMCY